MSHSNGVDPYGTGGNTVPIMAVGEQAPETVPCHHPDADHRAALSEDDEQP